ncbi:DotH/IcmK family type IV secretion protein [Serratia symbiotica]|nr:DotH/IcmK family type IV secretion protein [Serratia symbiotica]
MINLRYQALGLMLWCCTSAATPAKADGQGATVTTPATRESVGPQPGDALPPPSASYDQAEATVAPLTADEIRRLRQQQSDQDRAIASPMVAVVPRISALTVSLAPGASLPLVRNAVNWPATISFIDSTGAPWKILGEPVSGASALIVKWLPGTSVMTLIAKRNFINTSVTVALEGLAVPVTISVMSGEPDTAKKTWVVDARLDLRIPQRGPGAAADAPPPARIGLHDSILQAFLDGVPPQGARRLKSTGRVPDTEVWQLGDTLYLRSRAEIRDEFDATLSSADGTHLWTLPVTPRVAFSVDGHTEALSIVLE